MSENSNQWTAQRLQVELKGRIVTSAHNISEIVPMTLGRWKHFKQDPKGSTWKKSNKLDHIKLRTSVHLDNESRIEKQARVRDCPFYHKSKKKKNKTMYLECKINFQIHGKS